MTNMDRRAYLTAAAALGRAVADGAVGLGEIKAHVAADGPELRRLYALAAELNVPIMVHFQEVEHFEGEGLFATGFKQFEAGRGAGVSQANNPRAARLAGKCVARETLTLLKSASTPEVFRKLTWVNARQLFRLGL